MTINQLFKIRPSQELIYRYCHLFGLAGMSDRKWFTKNDMARCHTVSKIQDTVFDDLKKLYVDCKAKSYLTEINDKSAITILRQLIKTLDYTLKRRTVTISGIRCTEYQLNKT